MKSEVVLSLIIASGLLTCQSHTAEAVFTISKEESRIEGGGHVAGYPIVEQGPGSLVSTAIGEIKANLESNTFQLLPTTLIDAEINGEWQPGLGGVPGFAPADFAGQANVVLTQVKGAFRNVILTAYSDPIPVSNGSFDGSNITLEFPTNSPAVFEYNGGWFGADSVSLAGWTTRLTNSVGSITQQDGKETVTLTFDGAFPFTALNPNDSEVRIKGKLVASRTLSAPQPRFTGIVRQDQTIILTAVDVPAGVRLDASTNLEQWDLRAAVRTDNNGTTQFTFQSAETAEFYRLLVP